jgi:hypothetical protein
MMYTTFDDVHNIWWCIQHLMMYTTFDDVHNIWWCTQHLIMYTTTDEVNNKWWCTQQLMMNHFKRISTAVIFYDTTSTIILDIHSLWYKTDSHWSHTLATCSHSPWQHALTHPGNMLSPTLATAQIHSGNSTNHQGNNTKLPWQQTQTHRSIKHGSVQGPQSPFHHLLWCCSFGPLFVAVRQPGTPPLTGWARLTVLIEKLTGNLLEINKSSSYKVTRNQVSLTWNSWEIF